MTSSDQQCAALVVTVAEPKLRGPAGAADAARARHGRRDRGATQALPGQAPAHPRRHRRQEEATAELLAARSRMRAVCVCLLSSRAAAAAAASCRTF